MPEEKQITEEIEKKFSPDIMRTLLQEGVDFEVTVKNKTFLHRFKLAPISRKFIVYPINLGTLLIISKVIMTMTEINALDNEDLFAVGIRNIMENKDKMVEVIALAILNRKTNTAVTKLKKWWLVRYLDNNLDPRELLQLVNLVIAQMDVTDFLASFVSIKRLNLTEARKVKAVS